MDCLPQIHIAALHAEHGYRGFTPGLGELCRSNERIMGFGAYQNSIGKGSAYLAAGWQPGSVGIVGGLVSGYRSQPVPMAALLVSYRDVHFTAIPPFKGKTPLTVGISYTWR